jgi:hypothetical protein
MKKIRVSSRVRTPKVPGGFPHVVHTRLTDSQFERLQKMAEERGLSISTLLREIVVRALTSNVATIPPHREAPGIRGRAQQQESAYGNDGRLGRRRGLRG